MTAIIPARTSGNISTHGSGPKCSQVFVVGICELRLIVIQIDTSINLGHGLKKANAFY